MTAPLRSFLALAALSAGATSQSTERVNVATNGTEANRISESPVISADGRFVAFESFASNLVANDTNAEWDVFVHDRQTGVTQLASIATDWTQGNGRSSEASLSGDGRFVAFRSSSTTLVPSDTNGYSDVFVRDRLSGVTRCVSVDSTGAPGNGTSYAPALSPDGTLIVFASNASNLVPGDTNAYDDVFLHVLATAATTRVSVGQAGQADAYSLDPKFAGRGRYVVFRSAAANLVAGDTNNRDDVFVRDLVAGITTLRSIGDAGNLGDGVSSLPSISRDARFVVFASDARNLVPGDVNFSTDVFVHDRVSGRTRQVSVASGGAHGDDDSFVPSISDDGRFVSYWSASTNLVAGDTNALIDVFVHDLLLEETSRVSLDSAGAQGNDNSRESSISADGRFVAFDSAASNLVPGDTNGTLDIFVRDRFGARPPRVFCAGDGSGQPCPCASTEPWHGCANSAFAMGGALLLASGASSVAADSVELRATRLPAGETAVLFQAPAAQGGGPGAVLGDGVLCLLRPYQRIATRITTNGTVTYGPSAGDPSLSIVGGVPPGGGRFLYQLWYRDGAPTCTPATENFTNGLEVFWTP